MNNFTMIVAMCEKTRGIGYQGTIPWKSKEDMAFFRTTTTTVPSEEYINVVIMGRKTFESLGSRPLKGRLNIVCSRTTENKSTDMNLLFVKSLSEALSEDVVRLETPLRGAPPLWRRLEKTSANYTQKINKIFVIGGEQLYREGINHPYCEEILMNCLKLPIHEYDAFFPEVDANMYELTERYETDDIVYTRYIIRRFHQSKIGNIY